MKIKIFWSFLLLLIVDSFVLGFSGDTSKPWIIVDPDTNKIYVTTGYFQNTGLKENDTGNNKNYNSGSINTGIVVNFGTSDKKVIKTGEEEKDIYDQLIDYNTDQSNYVPTNTEKDENNKNEFEQALEWMYKKGLTKYNNIEEYRPNAYLIREESAKILGQLYKTLGYNQKILKTGCNFEDDNIFDPSLSGRIKNVCGWKLFQGYEGNFMPKKTLTKPETMAVLIRMFEGKKSNEKKEPRWGEYYLKGQAIGLIKSGNIDNYNSPITRKQVALYVFRLKNIVLDQNLKTMSINQISKIGEKNNYQSELIKENLSDLAGNIDASQDPELQEAIKWMYDNKITIHKNIQSYDPFRTITRAEVSKMLNGFANIFNLVQYDNFFSNQCEFKDLENVPNDLVEHIKSVCKMGLLNGYDGIFNPNGNTTKSQFIVSLIRLFEGKHLDETGKPWWKEYFQKAQELGIVTPADAITFDSSITRYEVALFLYRFKVKYQMLQNLNTDKLQDEIISTVSGSIQKLENGLSKSNVYIDVNLLRDGNFEVGYIELFGTRYKVQKTATEKYFTNNFVRYGDIYDLFEEKKVGTLNFIIGNSIVLEGTVRFEKGNNYIIKNLNNTNSFYTLEQIN